MTPENAAPGDGVLLAAAGWSDVPSARILAKYATDHLCVVVLDSNGGLGGRSYETVELFVRTETGWENTGDFGPAAGGGSGWADGHMFTYGQSPDPEVRIVLGGRWYQVLTQTDGWYAFAARQDEYNPTGPRLE